MIEDRLAAQQHLCSKQTAGGQLRFRAVPLAVARRPTVRGA